MADSPLLTLTRLLGGVVLMQGRIGHQILGQLLVLGTNEVALAGALAVIAATSGQRNAGAQIAIRTVVPALAVRGLLDKQERRIDWKESVVAKRERKVAKREKKITELEEEIRRLQKLLRVQP